MMTPPQALTGFRPLTVPLRRDFTSRPRRDSITAFAARQAPDAHPTLSHTVSDGDTLWDVSVRYGVPMKNIRAVNGLPGDFVNIQPGEHLLLPVGAVHPAGVAAAQADQVDVPAEISLESRTKAEDTSATSLWLQQESCIKHTTPDQIEKILLAQGTVEADKDTVVVTYTPDCKHCHSIETLMDTVAHGLAHDPNLQILALCCDTSSLKTWAKESLAVRRFPSIMALPRGEPNVYRLTERGRTESGITIFLNTVFQREGDAVLAFRAPAGTATAVAAAPANTPVGVVGAAHTRPVWPYIIGGVLVVVACTVFRSFRNYMVTPLGRSVDAADGTLPAEVGEAAAVPPYRSGRSGQRSRRVSTDVAGSVAAADVAAAAAPAAAAKKAAAALAFAAGTGADRGPDEVDNGAPAAATKSAATVAASAVGGEKDVEAAGGAVTAPRNPWAAPPEPAGGEVAPGGMVKVTTVAEVAAEEIAVAVAEGVERAREAKGVGEMARTDVGEAPPWQQLGRQAVLEAWHECDGDVDVLVDKLKASDGTPLGTAEALKILNQALKESTDKLQKDVAVMESALRSKE
eukprot:jgi/Ulvmu1/3404/UM016_0021.1